MGKLQCFNNWYSCMNGLQDEYRSSAMSVCISRGIYSVLGTMAQLYSHIIPGNLHKHSERCNSRPFFSEEETSPLKVIMLVSGRAVI